MLGADIGVWPVTHFCMTSNEPWLLRSIKKARHHSNVRLLAYIFDL